VRLKPTSYRARSAAAAAAMDKFTPGANTRMSPAATDGRSTGRATSSTTSPTLEEPASVQGDCQSPASMRGSGWLSRLHVIGCMTWKLRRAREPGSFSEIRIKSSRVLDLKSSRSREFESWRVQARDQGPSHRPFRGRGRRRGSDLGRELFREAGSSAHALESSRSVPQARRHPSPGRNRPAHARGR
jgi:hypothetical protein